MASQSRIKVLNPEADRIPVSNESIAETPSWSMAPRPESLNGKTVYLVNQGFGGSDLFMEQFQAWFARNMPDVKTVLRRKTGFIFARAQTPKGGDVHRRSLVCIVQEIRLGGLCPGL
ncbi:MAG: hypothetical protein P8Z37_10740 [Acidobacteriota bacterium]